MKNGKKIVALVPLRGGSKSIQKKNIKIIAGKPLCAWVIEQALKVKEIDEIYVSTDDKEITEIVTSIDTRIKIVDRPAEFATDTASTESVMLHFSSIVEFDLLITIQATSPLTQASDFQKGINLIFSAQFDSILTGTRLKRFFWEKVDEIAHPINYNYKKRPRRQEFKGTLMENGAFYITKKNILTTDKCRLGGKIGFLELPKENAVEIDEPGDWDIIESLLWKNQKNNLLGQIKALVIDVDGTLTDGGMYYTKNGEFLKKFNTRDAKGLELIQKTDIEVILLTAEESDVVRARAHKLSLKNVYYGIKNKMPKLQEICETLGITLNEVAYIGDDINDLDCLLNVKFSACPSDAHPEVLKKVSYICKRNGGNGAVREICDLLLKN